MTPLRFSQVVAAMAPVSLFMTEVAAWFTPLVLLPYVTKSLPYPRRLLTTPALVLGRVWDWYLHASPSIEIVPRPGTSHPLNVQGFISWLELDMQTINKEYSRLKSFYDTMKTFKLSNIDEQIQQMMAEDHRDQIWQDSDWEVVDGKKWSPTLLSWTGSPKGLAAVCAGAGLTIRTGLLRSCPGLHSVRSKLEFTRDGFEAAPGFSIDEGKEMLDELGGIWPSDGMDFVPAVICDKAIKATTNVKSSIHRLLSNQFGHGYTDFHRKTIDKVCKKKSRAGVFVDQCQLVQDLVACTQEEPGQSQMQPRKVLEKEGNLVYWCSGLRYDRDFVLNALTKDFGLSTEKEVAAAWTSMVRYFVPDPDAVGSVSQEQRQRIFSIVQDSSESETDPGARFDFQGAVIDDATMTPGSLEQSAVQRLKYYLPPPALISKAPDTAVAGRTRARGVPAATTSAATTRTKRPVTTAVDDPPPKRKTRNKAPARE